jgi:hypothetical protein
MGDSQEELENESNTRKDRKGLLSDNIPWKGKEGALFEQHMAGRNSDYIL